MWIGRIARHFSVFVLTTVIAGLLGATLERHSIPIARPANLASQPDPSTASHRCSAVLESSAKEHLS
jgi:hypothetical protein